MEIKTKYNIGDKVWFIRHNKIQHEKIDRISIDVVNHTKNVKTVYYLCGSVYMSEDSELFPTKEELLKSL